VIHKINEKSRSKCTSEDIDDADQGRRVPFHSDSPVNFVVPETRARDVESAISFLHDDAVGDEFEVFVECCDVFEDLNKRGVT